MIYWPEFSFDFRLDEQRLVPHLAAIEAFQETAFNRILPPGWREKTATESAQFSVLDLPAEQQPRMEAIFKRKQELLNANSSPAQKWVRERFVPGTAPLSLEDILTMHRLAADESGLRYTDSGTLRTSPVVVGRAPVGLHSGAPAERLPLLMNAYIRFVNGGRLQKLPAPIQALLAHFFITTIHPFADGNGRVCRLVSAALLFQRGYKGHGYYALARYFYQHDMRYHTLLHRCWQKPLPFDVTEFVAFGLEGLAMELQDIRNFVRIKLNRSVERTFLTPALAKRYKLRTSIAV